MASADRIAHLPQGPAKNRTAPEAALPLPEERSDEREHSLNVGFRYGRSNGSAFWLGVAGDRQSVAGALDCPGNQVHGNDLSKLLASTTANQRR